MTREITITRRIPVHQWLREKRLELFMTQEEFAYLLNVNVRTLKRWEANANNISYENLWHIVKLESLCYKEVDLQQYR